MRQDKGLDLLHHLADERIPKATQLLIFTDLNMPKMNGFELITQLVNLDYLSKYKVVMYSTSSNAEHQQQAKELGASSYVIKPSDFQPLVNTLQDIIPRLPIVK
jgi:CheY-like chemotaxis protein